MASPLGPVDLLSPSLALRGGVGSEPEPDAGRRSRWCGSDRRRLLRARGGERGPRAPRRPPRPAGGAPRASPGASSGGGSAARGAGHVREAPLGLVRRRARRRGARRGPGAEEVLAKGAEEVGVLVAGNGAKAPEGRPLVERASKEPPHGWVPLLHALDAGPAAIDLDGASNRRDGEAPDESVREEGLRGVGIVDEHEAVRDELVDAVRAADEGRADAVVSGPRGLLPRVICCARGCRCGRQRVAGVVRAPTRILLAGPWTRAGGRPGACRACLSSQSPRAWGGRRGTRGCGGRGGRGRRR